MTVTALNIQTVGQSLTLECTVTAVRGITSRVDIIWSRNGRELERIEGSSDGTELERMEGSSNGTELEGSSDGIILERIEGVSVGSTTDNSVVYTDTYSIPQLSTTDDGIDYQCEVVINTSPPVMAYNSVRLDVVGKCVLFKFTLVFCTAVVVHSITLTGFLS